MNFADSGIIFRQAEIGITALNGYVNKQKLPKELRLELVVLIVENYFALLASPLPFFKNITPELIILGSEFDV